mgnify:CR=1 FL=1
MNNKIFTKFIIWLLIACFVFEAAPVLALTKDETIYVTLNSDGQVNNIIVSEHLNDNGSNLLKDKSNLSNIKNVNGNETYTKSDDAIIWESNGNDIYYQGSTNNELPISLSIKYYLNDEEMKVDEMLGKKGKVKVVLKYTNKDKHNVIVNNHNEVMYTPFLVATTTSLSNIENKNLEVTNGKIIDNGVNSVIVALTSPGLYESLDMDALKDFDTVIISYDTEYFEMGPIYSIATSKLIDKDDLSVFDNIDELYASINKLVNASNEIRNGSEQLKNGAIALQQGANSLKGGINNAYVGSKTIRDTVKNSINQLESDNSPALDDATLAYIESEAKKTTKESLDLKLTDDYLNVIGQNAVDALANNDTYKGLINNKIQLENAGITMELVKMCNSSEITEENMMVCANNATYITQYTTVLQMITLMEETTRETAKETAKSTAYNTAEEVSSNVSKNVALKIASQAKEEATTETIDSLNKLVGGLDELTNGLGQLNNGASTLYDGTTQLANGITTLTNGIDTFNNEGINRLSNVFNGDVKNIEYKIKALVNLGNDYGTFDDMDENATGSSKIIMIVDAVKNEETKKKSNNEKIIDTKKSYKQRIKGLLK